VVSRREFFASFKKATASSEENERPSIRPPYGLDEATFLSGCVECEGKECSESCDENIIKIQDGMPILDFGMSGCTFCDDCAKACSQGVLSLENVHTSATINALFKIEPQKCLAHNGTICFACKEPCIDDAILFNGMFNPVIDMDSCTACGFCVSRCPTDAIEFEGVSIAKELS